MKKVIFFFFFVFVAGNLSFGQTDKAYTASVKKMLELSGSQETFKTAIKQMISMFRQQKTGVPDSFWTEVEADFSGTTMDELVEMLAPIYQKYLTLDDIQKISEFYQTPVGKKFAEKTPLIMTESMQVGQQWGMKIGQKVQGKLKEKGY